MLSKLKKDLQSLASPEKAAVLQRFFKTGKGDYGEGDVFLGITVPEQRKVAKKYVSLDLSEVKSLLKSEVHEHRLVAFLILVEKFENGNKKEIYGFTLKNAQSMNNWDLVDLTAPKIVGAYLLDKDKKILYQLAKSDNLWERRISIIATYTFIRNHEFEDTLRISEILLNDKHDLIHKAVGWMLRELGKKNQNLEEDFLKKYHKRMPRTMLRYAIEKFPEYKRIKYMGKNK